RNTRIKTFDGKDVFIPNASMIKNRVTNFVLDGFLRQDFSIKLDATDQVDQAREIIKQQLDDIPGILQEEKAPSVHLTELGPNQKNLTAYYWIDTFDQRYSGLEMKTQALNRCQTALIEAGYYLPGDVLELKGYKDQRPNMMVDKVS
ncbi:MAG: mechanosensitive ion channel family protein, partial [Bacteroidota bacterium]